MTQLLRGCARITDRQQRLAHSHHPPVPINRCLCRRSPCCLPLGACRRATRSLPAEFSFFNHSCVPNCINWVLPGEPRAMVVRAAASIPAGCEATISYLGAPQLLPLSGRQQALGNFGFTCRCV